MSETTSPSTAELRRNQEALQARVARLEAALAPALAALPAVVLELRRRVPDQVGAPPRPDLDLVDGILTAINDPDLSLQQARELLAAAISEFETLDVLADPESLARLEQAEAEIDRGEIVSLEDIRGEFARWHDQATGGIGEEIGVIEIVPMPVPEEAPAKEPSPQVHPAKEHRRSTEGT